MTLDVLTKDQLTMLDPQRLLTFLQKHYSLSGDVIAAKGVHPRVDDPALVSRFTDMCAFMNPQKEMRYYLFRGDTQKQIGTLIVESGVISYTQRYTAPGDIRGHSIPVNTPYEAITLDVYRHLHGQSSDAFTAPNKLPANLTRVIAERDVSEGVFVSRKDTIYFVQPGTIRCRYAGNLEPHIPTEQFQQGNVVPRMVHHTLGAHKPIRHSLGRLLPAGPAKRDVA